MAKKTQEKTEAAKKVLDLRQKLSLAKDADAKASTDKTKDHVKTLSNQLATAVEVDNRERFIRIAGGRVKKARTAIRNLAAVAAPRSYKYDESDVVKAETALGSDLKATLTKLRNALVKGASAAKAEDDFTF